MLLSISDVEEPTKTIIVLPGGEHAIMEKKNVYPHLNEEIDKFIKKH